MRHACGSAISYSRPVNAPAHACKHLKSVTLITLAAAIPDGIMAVHSAISSLCMLALGRVSGAKNRPRESADFCGILSLLKIPAQLKHPSFRIHKQAFTNVRQRLTTRYKPLLQSSSIRATIGIMKTIAIAVLTLCLAIAVHGASFRGICFLNSSSFALSRS